MHFALLKYYFVPRSAWLKYYLKNNILIRQWFEDFASAVAAAKLCSFFFLSLLGLFGQTNSNMNYVKTYFGPKNISVKLTRLNEFVEIVLLPFAQSCRNCVVVALQNKFVNVLCHCVCCLCCCGLRKAKT